MAPSDIVTKDEQKILDNARTSLKHTRECERAIVKLMRELEGEHLAHVLPLGPVEAWAAIEGDLTLWNALLHSMLQSHLKHLQDKHRDLRSQLMQLWTVSEATSNRINAK